MLMKASFSFILVLFALAISGCSTARVVVPIMRPAELDVGAKRNLAVEPIASTNGDQLRSLVESSIYESERFDLVRTTDFKPDENFETALADRADAMLVRAVVFRDAYSESTDKRESTCTRESNGKKFKYQCNNYTRRGTYEADIAFELIDLETKERLRPKRITCKRLGSTYAQDRVPDGIDARPLVDHCVQEVARGFMRAIAPWTDKVSLPFQTDGDLPELEHGVGPARVGDWPAAISRFRAAVERGATLGEPEVEAKAHFNLALALAVTQEFTAARESLHRALRLSERPLYRDELERLDALEEESVRLREQPAPAGSGGASAR